MSEWAWYAGQDGEHFGVGPHKTRDDAIAEARDEYEWEQFTVLEARKGEANHSIFGSSLFEMIDDANSEEMGDGDPLSTYVTDEQAADLEKRLEAVVKTWMDEINLHSHVWLFSQTRNRCEVIIKHEEEKTDD